MAIDYQSYPYVRDMIGIGLFDDVSKGALATVVGSLLSTGGDHPEQVRGRLLVELENLHAAGLIPARIRPAYRDEAAAARVAEES